MLVFVYYKLQYIFKCIIIYQLNNVSVFKKNPLINDKYKTFF